MTCCQDICNGRASMAHFRKNPFIRRECSETSGVPLCTMQQYEQRQKNINKAQAEYPVMLSRVLCCDIDVLLEKTEPNKKTE